MVLAPYGSQLPAPSQVPPSEHGVPNAEKGQIGNPLSHAAKVHSGQLAGRSLSSVMGSVSPLPLQTFLRQSPAV